MFKFTLLFMLILLPAGVASAAANKVEICHASNGGASTQALPVNAATQHLRNHFNDSPGPCGTGDTETVGQCGFWRETAKNAVKWPPIRMDMNADYLMFAAPALPDRAFILRATLPYSAYVSITTYTDNAQGIPYAALNATNWVDDSGSLLTNPWQTGNIVNTAPGDRQVTIVVTPREHYQRAKQLGYENVIAYAPPFAESERFSPMMVFVYRAYLSERFDPNSVNPDRPVPFDTYDLFDRRGFVEQPKVFAVSARDLVTPMNCPQLDIKLELAAETVGEAPSAFFTELGVPLDIGTFGNPPNIPGRVAFYRIPIPLIQYAGAGSIPPDGSNPVDQLDSCTGYLSAGLYDSQQINLVGFKTQPTAFDNSTLLPGSDATYERGDVFYYSLGSYGPTNL